MQKVEWTEEAEAASRRLIERRIEQGIGSRGDHARRGIGRGGRRVRCAGSTLDGSDACGWRGKLRTSRRRRLRHIPCPGCGGQVRPANWPGFDTVQ